MEIKKVSNPELNATICNNILKNLPEWFGVESIINDYKNHVKKAPCFVAYMDETPVGFLTLKIHNIYTAEIYVMGILNEYQRKNIGTDLVKTAETYCKENNLKFLTVKTLDSSISYEPYERTRNFYRKIGFFPLEVFPLLWDKNNPCLFLVKNIDSNS